MTDGPARFGGRDDEVLAIVRIWHVLADPDGNEFCVLQPPADPSDNPAV